MARQSMNTTPARHNENESIVAHFSDGLLLHFAREETIIHGYDEPEGVYLIKKGFVKAHSVSHHGHGNLLIVHEANEFIPMPWALDGPHTTGLFYEAMNDVTILRVPKNKLRAALGHNAWLSQEILKQSVNIITSYTKRIQTLEFRSARGRIISELLYLAERFGRQHGTEIVIDAPITHQDLADSINMNRETASRAVELLFNEKLMGQKAHRFIVRDLSKLQAELS
ncbi:Crp/Fnr family transcriptional regulator [Candidatus Parcubacteria bacterium]|nr:Crp/Fnr family transcriptional regulator [Candidatus Parcubacteria bacterium]